jgi:hypothetical protein
MKYKDACNFLEIDPDSPLSDVLLKKQYHKLALKYHPDKNKSSTSSDTFHQIKEAYDYLMKDEGYIDDDINDYFEDATQSYRNLLFSFINTVVGEDNSNLIIRTILNKISSMCQEKALETLDRLDKQTLLKVYELVLKYHEAFHFETVFIDKIRELVITKSSSDERILLNPSLEDLFSQNLYKLTNNKNTYYIPLWQNEVIFDSSGTDLYVVCEPELPAHITIDERNNIHVNISRKIEDLWGKEYIDVIVGNKNIPIHVDILHLKSTQSVRYANIGIPIAKSKNVYDVSNLSDIIIHMNLHLTNS